MLSSHAIMLLREHSFDPESNSCADASAQAGIIPSVQYSEDCESGVTEKPIDGGAQQESK